MKSDVPSVLSSSLGILAAFALAAAFVGCTKRSDGTAATADVVREVCALPEMHETSDGERVRVRGRFDMHAHGVFLRDDRCPGFMVALKYMDGGPDVSLCTPERLAQEFGCPGGNHNGPMVTVIGVLNPSHSPKYGEVVVAEMRDFENARTGERFTF